MHCDFVEGEIGLGDVGGNGVGVLIRFRGSTTASLHATMVPYCSYGHACCSCVSLILQPAMAGPACLWS